MKKSLLILHIVRKVKLCLSSKKGIALSYNAWSWDHRKHCTSFQVYLTDWYILLQTVLELKLLSSINPFKFYPPSQTDTCRNIALHIL